MSNNPIFKGAATALITPIDENGVDYARLEKLIEWQISEGINALVICGTTGESSTLTDEEHKEVIRFSVDKAKGRIPVIAGTGSNDTEYAAALTEFACNAGADAVLLVTPYYNKTSQEGLIKSFKTIADHSTKPVILYNVPSRTGVNIEPETYVELSKHQKIQAVKEAAGNISQIAKIAAMVGDKFDIYSGNDDEILPIMSLGGIGVISVLSNLLPKETVKICDEFFKGNIAESRRLQLKYLPLINALFSEVNPIPVKSAMAQMGFCKNYLRLPLVEMNKKKEAVLIDIMKEHGLI